MSRKYISDIIANDDIDSWNSNEIVFIEAPTGSGKSHFIKATLAKYKSSSKILILVNRITIKNQSSKELDRQDVGNITIVTYQSLARKILTFKTKEFEGYDFIFCDEAHHFFEESDFVFETDVSFNWVLKQKAIRVFMTATALFIKKYIGEEMKLPYKHYKLENKYNFIDKLYFYNNDDVIKKLLLDLPPDEKAIYFTSANKAYETSLILDSCAFYCSKGNYKFHQFANKETIEYIEENEKFEDQILCTTKVMDCGVNIIDSQLKHIIVDMVDISSLIQCIGRKRIVGNEKINVYIKDKKGNAIIRKIENIESKLYYANILIEKGALVLVQENAHKNTYGNLIYDVINKEKLKIDKKLNELMYFTYNENLEIYAKMLNDKDGFKKELFERMNIDMKYSYLEKELDALKLENILDKLVGVKMFKDEQQNFKELLLRELLQSPKGSHGSIGLKTINALFDENKLNYIVNSKREKSGDNRDKIYWAISKL